MIHPTVDIQRWMQRYPLEAHFASLERRIDEILMKEPGRFASRGEAEAKLGFWWYAPNDIFSPRNLALTEQMRGRGGEMPWSEGVPVDVLLPALGEPPRREVSKIGGLPYRPKGSWPVDAEGNALSFIGQLCFADSMDILAARGIRGLPGDVLLVFQESDDFIGEEDCGAPLRFEWYRVGMTADELVAPEHIPPQSVSFTPTYFERYRSVDFEEAPSAAVGLDALGQFVARYHASKIGGLPPRQQEEQDDLGTFLGCLHSINPYEDEYPFPNLRSPPWKGYAHDRGFFMLGDVGTLYLFWDGNRVRWTMQCG